MAKNQTTLENETPDPAPEEHLEKATDGPGADIQKATDKAEDKGYIGEKVDPLPNSHYSQEGGPPGV